ncbi:MAG: sensor histidine kinase [Lachnospiraceae bacterium]|nr:sensor histidine kinase [Lachnospiraceae bacterium]
MAICLIPMAAVIVFMLVLMQSFTHNYDLIVDDIIKANAYNIDFKSDMDFSMYTIIVNSDRAGELVDLDKPFSMIKNARTDFKDLYDKTDSDAARNQLDRILRTLDTLEERVTEIVDDSKVLGSYSINMERLDNNVRILTELIQDQIQEYINYQVIGLDELRLGIKQNLNISVIAGIAVFFLIILGAVLISRRIMKGIVEPVKELCEVAGSVGTGDFDVRARSDTTDELAILGQSFNEMVGRIGTLVEDVRAEQEKLRVIELQLLQEQINPHFLYNTLDTITWLSEMGENDQVILMVNSLSDFFRTGLSSGKSMVSIREEIKHVESYLKIQQFRYQDILEFEVEVDDSIGEYRIPKLTLQPLVENALYHGIKNKRAKGRIIVSGRQDGDNIILSVKDDGVGMEPEALDKIRKNLSDNGPGSPAESGFGLRNVLERIRLTYGNDYGIEIDSIYGAGTSVMVKIPCE